MSQIQVGQKMEPRDFFVRTCDGKHELLFATMKEAQRAQMFMEAAVQMGREQGEDRIGRQLDELIEGLEDHVVNCNDLRASLQRARQSLRSSSV